MTTMKKLRALLLVLAASLVMSGCDFDVYKLPLPGGTDTGDNPITVHAKFHDVLDLVPKSTVKVNDVSVGQVTDIDLEGYVADVTLELREDTKLPDNAVAELRQTSLLGEKFVSLSAPEEGASDNPLQTGDVITIERTGRNPEVEEVLGALSLLLNGGGVAQLKTIAHELNLALEGREGSTKSVLRQIEALMTQLDANKADIVNAIESLNRLAIAVNDQTDSIDSALEELPSALTSLDQQRDDLVKMLKALNRLGDVGVGVIQASKESTIESFRQLSPVLTELANSGDDFVNAFHVFLTYPFVDEVVGRDPQVARNLHMGDYTNLSIQMDVAVTDGAPTLPTNLPTILDPGQVIDTVTRCLRSGDLTSRACRKLLNDAGGLAKLREECAKPKNEDKDVCKQLNLVPGLPLPSNTGGGGLPIPIPGVPRPGYGPTTGQPSARGPTIGQLMKTYDPDLVSLLVPGMVVSR
jgi:phospholipid/cholesterol/gamma-HCH transport system substrate-binding protein